MSDLLIPLFLVSDVSESLRSLTNNERCERIAQVAHQKWANHSFFWANCSFAHFWAKNNRFAQKTDERIPSPVKIHFEYVFLWNFWKPCKKCKRHTIHEEQHRKYQGQAHFLKSCHRSIPCNIVPSWNTSSCQITKVQQLGSWLLAELQICSGSLVSHRLLWRLMQLPSWPGNFRICYYCPLRVLVSPL